MTFETILDGYEARVDALVDIGEPAPPATSTDLARAEEIYGHRFPDEVKALYGRYNGGLYIANQGWLMPLPTTHREGLEDAPWAAGAPFGFRDHLPLIRFDRVAFNVALDAEHRGQIWRIAIDVDPPPVVRVASDLGSMFGAWNRLLDDGAFLANGNMLIADDGSSDHNGYLRSAFHRYGSEINPYLYADYLPLFLDEAHQGMLDDCGVQPGDTYERREELTKEIEAFLVHQGEGRSIDPVQEAHSSRMQEGMMRIISEHVTRGTSSLGAIEDEMDTFVSDYMNEHDLGDR